MIGPDHTISPSLPVVYSSCVFVHVCCVLCGNTLKALFYQGMLACLNKTALVRVRFAFDRSIDLAA